MCLDLSSKVLLVVLQEVGNWEILILLTWDTTIRATVVKLRPTAPILLVHRYRADSSTSKVGMARRDEVRPRQFSCIVIAMIEIEPEVIGKDETKNPTAGSWI